MSTIRVVQPHQQDRQQAKQSFGSFEEMMGKYGVKLKWKGDKASIKGLGVSGDVDVSDQAITVTLKLGMMAKAAGVDATRLEASIRKRLTAAFASNH